MRNLSFTALAVGIVLILASAGWGITVAGDGSPVPTSSVMLFWLGVVVAVVGSIGLGVTKKQKRQ